MFLACYFDDIYTLYDDIYLFRVTIEEIISLLIGNHSNLGYQITRS